MRAATIKQVYVKQVYELTNADRRVELFNKIIKEVAKYDLGELAYLSKLSKGTLTRWLALDGTFNPHLNSIMKVLPHIGLEIRLIKRTDKKHIKLL